MSDDASLLLSYAENGSERAFAELVNRHINLVYAAALRRTSGDNHLAEDVCQKVFIELARSARRLSLHPALGAWLHAATRNIAINIMKSEWRRMRRESEAQEFHSAADAATIDWNQLRPVLDDAVDRLREVDRAALILRYFEQRPFAAVGKALRVSEDAARMRVERALKRLRRVLERRGITSTAGALALTLENRPSVAAPAALVVAATRSALAASAAGTASIFPASIFTMSTAKGIAIVAVATASLGLILHHKHRASAREGENPQVVSESPPRRKLRRRRLSAERLPIIPLAAGGRRSGLRMVRITQRKRLRPLL